MPSLSNDEFKILFVSDFHAAAALQSTVGRLANSASDTEQAHRLLLGVIQEMVHSVAPDVLVLGGDFVERGSRGEFDQILKCTIQPLLKDLNPLTSVFFLAGNHDIDWTAPDRQDRLKPWKSFQDSVLADFPPPREIAFVPRLHVNSELIYHWQEFSGKRVGLLALDSVSALGGQKVDGGSIYPGLSGSATIDPAWVSLDKMTATLFSPNEVQSRKDATIRIALLHHNPLPYQREGVRPLGFVNSGELLSFLLRDDFALCLHGHQHCSGTQSFRTYDTSQGSLAPSRDGSAQSILESGGINTGLVCVGAAACGAVKGELGCAKITINLAHAPEIIPFEVKHITYDERRAMSFSRQSFSRLVADSELRANLKRVSEAVSSGQMERVRIGVTDESATEIPDFFRRLRSMRRDLIDIRAIYSLSVFSAKDWNDSHLAEFFLEEAQRSTRQAVANQKALEFQMAEKEQGDCILSLRESKPTMLFRFSRPLKGAIDSALRLSQLLRVSSRIQEACEDARKAEKVLGQKGMQFVESYLGDRGKQVRDKFQSVSVWDNSHAIRTNRVSEANINKFDLESVDLVAHFVNEAFTYGSVGISELEWTPSRDVYHKMEDSREWSQLRNCLEFPRIVLWDPTEFDSDESLRCIEFHERCAFPIFWMDPRRLSGGAGKFMRRKDVGHQTIFCLGERNELNPPRKPFQPTMLYNHPDGRRFEIEGSTILDNYISHIWKERPPAELKNASCAMDEFSYLLGRSDIMLAADVWAMRKLGKESWADLEKALDGNEAMRAHA